MKTSRRNSAKKKRAVLIAGTLFAVTAAPSFALFGLGDVVFDPTSFAQLISQGSTILQQLETAQSQLGTAMSTYNTVQSTYQSMQANLQRFTGKNSWRTVMAALTQVHVQNAFGETTGWDNAMGMDDQAGATQAWKNATVAVDSSTATYLQGQAAGNSAQLSQLALIEASDSISPNCMNAVAQYRTARAYNAPAETALEGDEFDESDTTNSEVEQLNLLNAAQSQHLHELQLQGTLQTCLASQTAMANMQQRNAAAADLNTWAFVQQQRAQNPSNIDSSSYTWTHYLP